MAGDEAVNGITERFRKKDESVGPRPRPGELSGHMQSCAAFRVSLVVLNEHEAVHGFGIKAVLDHELSAEIGLQGSEPKDRARIMLDDEAHGPCTEVADAVEEDEHKMKDEG